VAEIEGARSRIRREGLAERGDTRGRQWGRVGDYPGSTRWLTSDWLMYGRTGGQVKG
jgi:hypothetical protein